MELSLTYWYLFPIGIIISSIAMTTGIEGGMFWAPVYFILAKLQPAAAVGMALITKAFGFTSGLYFHKKKDKIDWDFGIAILFFSVPASIIGSYIGIAISQIYLKLIFGIILILLSINLYLSSNQKQQQNTLSKQKIMCVRSNDKFSMNLFLKNNFPVIAAIGGILLGLISVGLGPIIGYKLIKYKHENIRVIISTTIFAIVITTYFAAISHIITFIFNDIISFSKVINILIFSIPGVIIGAKFGSDIVHNIDPNTLKKIIALISLIFGYIVLFNFIFTIF